TQTLRYLDKEFMAACDAEYAENVKEKKYYTSGYGNYHLPRWEDDYPFMGSDYRNGRGDSYGSSYENYGGEIRRIGSGLSSQEDSTKGAQLPLIPGVDDWDDDGWRWVPHIG